jgi:cytochrome c oxidase assembly protein subunit 15
MFAALLLLAIIIWIVEISRRSENKIVLQKSQDVLLKPLVIVSLIFTLIQVYLGTQVRESIDVIAESLNHEQRNLWIDMLPSSFVIHRALSLIVLAVNAFVLIRAFDQENKAIRKNAQLAGILVLAEIAVGFSFMLFDMPKFLQPTHLMLACFLFAVQTKLFFVINRK